MAKPLLLPLQALSWIFAVITSSNVRGQPPILLHDYGNETSEILSDNLRWTTVTSATTGVLKNGHGDGHIRGHGTDQAARMAKPLLLPLQALSWIFAVITSSNVRGQPPILLHDYGNETSEILSDNLRWTTVTSATTGVLKNGHGDGHIRGHGTDQAARMAKPLLLPLQALSWIFAVITSSNVRGQPPILLHDYGNETSEILSDNLRWTTVTSATTGVLKNGHGDGHLRGHGTDQAARMAKPLLLPLQ
ncbi:hypothetical protein MTO96_043857, partial [Rhipicephalus appendiculatus]